MKRKMKKEAKLILLALVFAICSIVTGILEPRVALEYQMNFWIATYGLIIICILLVVTAFIVSNHTNK